MTGLVSVHTLVTFFFFWFLPEYNPIKVGDGLSFYVVISTLFIHLQCLYSSSYFLLRLRCSILDSPPVSNTLVTMMQFFFPIRLVVGLRAWGTGLVWAPADPWE